MADHGLKRQCHGRGFHSGSAGVKAPKLARLAFQGALCQRDDRKGKVDHHDLLYRPSG